MQVVGAVALGLLVGLIMGGLGGGGAILMVPALVYLLGQTAHQAVAGSVVVVGAAAVTGVLSYARGHQLRWRLGLAFGGVGMIGSYVGTLLSRAVPARPLLIGFAAIMVVSSILLLRAPAGTDATVEEQQAARARRRSPVAVGVAGFAVGLLTGFFGVGGGFVIVPAMVLLFGLSMTQAAGTSLLVIAINSAAALLARLGDGHLDWAVMGPVTVAAMVGSVLGKSLAGRLPQRAQQRAFAALLLAVGLFVAVDNLF